MQKMPIHKQQISSSVRSCSSLLSGKCGSIASKIISLILVISTLFAFALPVSAVENGDFSFSDYNIKGYETYSTTNADGSTSTSYSQVSITTDIVTSGPFKGFKRYTFPQNSTSSKKLEIKLNLTEKFVITSGHEYNLQFSWGHNVALSTSCRVYLDFLDTNYNNIKTQELVLDTKNQIGTPFSINLNFTPKIDFEQAYNCYFRIEIIQPGIDTAAQSVFVSETITLTDKDDDTGLINSIIEAIKEIPDKIKGFFVELGETILNGIKDLFIPDEEYLQNKKAELETFCVEHFGAVYQSIDVFIDFLNTLVNISPTEPKITFPAIDVPVLGTTYHLTDAVEYSFTWVNDGSHFLHYFYSFYRGFVTVLLFLSFINYCRNKYAEIFGGDEE